MNDNDIALINKIKNTLDIDSDYWDFKNSKKEFLHGICSYPATMVPMMLSELIKFILEIDPNVKNLLDPFMGSGTTLLEGVNNNLEVFGIDINPLAYLLSEFKVSNIDI
ncbi:site-specific DNA-methyltransferase, partial [Clostridium perfringens]